MTASIHPSRIKTYADVFGLLLKERLPQLDHHLVSKLFCSILIARSLLALPHGIHIVRYSLYHAFYTCSYTCMRLCKGETATIHGHCVWYRAIYSKLVSHITLWTAKYSHWLKTGCSISIYLVWLCHVWHKKALISWHNAFKTTINVIKIKFSVKFYFSDARSPEGVCDVTHALCVNYKSMY